MLKLTTRAQLFGFTRLCCVCLGMWWTCLLVGSEKEEDVGLILDLDLPSGSAAEVLRQVSGRFGVDFIYSFNELKGLKTAPIKGSFTAGEALAALLQGSSLQVVHHEKSGVYAIRVESSEINPKQKTVDDTMELQNKEKRRGFLTALLSFLAVTTTNPVLGQETTVDDDYLEDEEIYTLSPFEVDTSENVGYYAASSLAGSRINSNIRDVAATISVATKEFLEDTNVDDVGALMVYSPSGESGGEFGSYSGLISADGDPAEALARPQSNIRVRGLDAPDLTRNYFLTDIGFDSYNTEIVEVNRGANSILFGLGSPAGIVNNSLIRPFYGDGGNVKFRLGEYGSHRTSLDYNKEVIEGKFAVRVAGLKDREEFKQRPAYEDTERYYIAAEWKFNDSARIKVNYETGNIDANRPNPVAPADWISPWLLAGSPIYDISKDLYDNTVNSVSASALFRNLDGSPYTGIPNNIILDLGMGTVLNSADAEWNNPGKPSAATIAGATGRHGVFIYEQPWDTNPSRYNANIIGIWLPRNKSAPIHPLDHDGDRTEWIQWRQIKRGLSNMYGQVGVKEQGLNSRELFDWVNNLLTGDAAFQKEDFETFNIAYEQQFLEDKNLGFELVFDAQNYNVEHHNPFNNFGGNPGALSIDIAPYLPIGGTHDDPKNIGVHNPNFLRPMISVAETSKSQSHVNRETYRATAFYKHDFTEANNDGWMQWLGRHVLSGIYNHQNIYRRNESDRLSETDTAFRKLWFFQDSDSWNARVKQAVYVGNSVGTGVSGYDDFQIHRLQGTRFWNPSATLPVRVWDPGWMPGTNGTEAGHVPNGNQLAGSEAILAQGGSDGSGNFNDFYTQRVPVRTWQRETLETVDTLAFNLQSFLLGGHLVGTAGWRQDDVELRQFQTSDYERDLYGGAIPSSRNIFSDEQGIGPDEVGSVTSEIFSWGLVGYLPDSWLDLPFGSRLSVHYGVSENFRPELGRIDPFGRSWANPGGETTEQGFTVSSFQDKLHVRVNWFETSLTNSTRDISGGVMNSFGAALSLAAQGTQQTVGSTDDHEVRAHALHRAVIDMVMANADPGLIAAQGINVREEAGAVIYDPTGAAPGQVDTVGRTAKGVEVEITYNPTPNWRIMANIAKQETVESNVLPASQEAYQAWVDLMNQPIPGFPELTLGEIERGGFRGYWPDSEGGARFSDDGESDNQATDSWATEYEQYAGVPLRTALAAEGSQVREQREWRANIISSYDFTEGDLAGLGIGGAWRFQSGGIIGYPFVPNDEGQLVGDTDNPHMSEDEHNFDFWMSYKMPFLKDKVDWSIQLNVRNVFTSEDDFIAIDAHQYGALDGMVSRVRYAPQRTIFLTNTFKF